MDGTKKTKLLSTNGPATDLTLDYDGKRLYWSQLNGSAIIMSCDLDGNDKTVIVDNKDFKPVGLTLYGDFIYWSDNKTGRNHLKILLIKINMF